MDSGDILEEISNENLPKLAKIYEKFKEEYPYVYSTILVGIKWKKVNPKDPRVLFVSPRNCWKDDGTFLAFFTFTTEVDVILFTLDDSAKNLCEGIKKTKRKQFDQEMNFYSTHDKFTFMVRKACVERKMETTLWIKSWMVRLPLETALKFKIDCPPEIRLKPLKIKDAALITSVWPRKYDGAETKIANLIELNGGIGAYLKKDDRLVAWVLRDQMGQVSVLQTDENFKKRGYAMLLTKALSKELAEEGVYPFAGINTKNMPSLRMFEKLGFEIIGPHTYFFMAPADPKNKL